MVTDSTGYSDAESADRSAYGLMASPRLAVATVAYVALAGYAIRSSNPVQFLVVALSLGALSVYWGWDAWNYEKTRSRLLRS